MNLLAAAPAPESIAMLGFGQVRHKRLRPVVNAFSYPTYLLMLPLRSLRRAHIGLGEVQKRHARSWQINTSGPLSFFEVDHGDGRAPDQGGALAWLDELLAKHGIVDATGEAWLQCYPRVLGFTFKPVSFWYCHRAPNDQGGALRAIVVEVNNTFGERHCYLLDAPRYGVEMQASKVFHVSPFCPVQGHYRFRFMRTPHEGPDRLVARIDYYDDAMATIQSNNTVLLQTSVSASLEPLTRQAMRRALWRYPAMTLGVVLHIHMQALRLWLSKVPFFSKPAPPKAFVTRA